MKHEQTQAQERALSERGGSYAPLGHPVSMLVRGVQEINCFQLSQERGPTKSNKLVVSHDLSGLVQLVVGLKPTLTPSETWRGLRTASFSGTTEINNTWLSLAKWWGAVSSQLQTASRSFLFQVLHQVSHDLFKRFHKSVLQNWAIPTFAYQHSSESVRNVGEVVRTFRTGAQHA